ncbi:GGGtGRT protein [uncultured Ruminococcus sp.]
MSINGRKKMGNNPMVGATVACAVAVEEAMK